MDRRSWLKSLAMFGAGAAALKVAAAQAADDKGIVLYCDLAVDPKRETEMLDAFHNHFKPVAMKHEGYIDLKMLKVSKLAQGPALPKGINYRFQLTYKNEPLRLKWVASADHAANWPKLENTLLDKNFQALVTDIV